MTPCINALIAGRGNARAPELLMLLFIVLMHDEDHECDASFAELAKAYGCNERNAKLLVSKLKRQGLLIVSKTKTEGHSRNVYRPTTCLPDQEPEAEAERRRAEMSAEIIASSKRRGVSPNRDLATAGLPLIKWPAEEDPDL